MYGDGPGGKCWFTHVVTPGSGFAARSYRRAAYAAYYRYVKRRLEQSLALDGDGVSYPNPVEHCEICTWRMTCEARRRRDDHLCLVAGISKIQVQELKRQSVGTLASLAQVPMPRSDWADWSRSGELLFALECRLYRIVIDGRSHLGTPEELIDLRDLKFEPCVAPREATVWSGR